MYSHRGVQRIRKALIIISYNSVLASEDQRAGDYTILGYVFIFYPVSIPIHSLATLPLGANTGMDGRGREVARGGVIPSWLLLKGSCNYDPLLVYFNREREKIT